MLISLQIPQKFTGNIISQSQRLTSRSDSVNEDGQHALPGIQVIRGDTISTQNIHQKTAKVLKKITFDQEILHGEMEKRSSPRKPREECCVGYGCTSCN